MEAAWGHAATESARGTDTMPSPGHEGDLYLRGECPETHAWMRCRQGACAKNLPREAAGALTRASLVQSEMTRTLVLLPIQL